MNILTDRSTVYGMSRASWKKEYKLATGVCTTEYQFFYFSYKILRKRLYTLFL